MSNCAILDFVDQSLTQRVPHPYLQTMCTFSSMLNFMNNSITLLRFAYCTTQNTISYLVTHVLLCTIFFCQFPFSSNNSPFSSAVCSSVYFRVLIFLLSLQCYEMVQSTRWEILLYSMTWYDMPSCAILSCLFLCYLVLSYRATSTIHSSKWMNKLLNWFTNWLIHKIVNLYIYVN